MVTISDFSEWLQNVLKEKELIQADLVRLSGLSPSQVSKIINLHSPPGDKAIQAISKALQLDANIVYRAAGKIPKVTIKQATMEELESIISQLPPDQVDELLEIGRLKVKNARKKLPGKDK